MAQNNHEKLDQEWIDLILQAKELGLSTEEVSAFLGKYKIPDEETQNIGTNAVSRMQEY